MVTPQLWNCQTGVSGCWCGQSRCCWLWETNKEYWSQSLMTPTLRPNIQQRQAAPFPPDPDPSRAGMPSTCVTSKHCFSSSGSQILNKPPRLSLGKGKYYYPSPKTRQVKCGLEWRSGTTFACELHNCYGLQELKPLIRATWWICHSVFEHEMETNFQTSPFFKAL